MSTGHTTGALASWAEVIAARRRDARPWLIVPHEPQRSAAHCAVSYAQLHDLALRIAGGLNATGAAPGQRVVVVADNSAESALLLLAVLQSGLVAVPVAPRGLSARDLRWEERLAEVCRDCEARLVVGRAQALPAAAAPTLPAPACNFDRLAAHAHPLAAPVPQGGATALLQYTSGTTTRARAVELTHDNLLHNVRSIGEALEASPRDVGVSWLPLFHDMGLIGCLLFATYWGMPMVLLTPRAFHLRPANWLWAISRFKGTCSVAPNSALALCASKLSAPKLQGLDLSSWRAALTGAELVHPETLEAFARRFAAHGFRRQALLPVYGLAENTLAATFPPLGRGPRVDWVDRDALEGAGTAHALPVRADHAQRAARGVISVGRPLRGQRVRVRTADGAPAQERQVGAIELGGPCVMRGYRGAAPRASGLSASALSEDGWLRTGDRGYLAAGELYVVGRDKHVIKRAGRSLDGEEIEAALRDVPGVRGSALAAFGVPSARTGSELLVVMAETRAHEPAARARLERAIAQRLDAALAQRPDIVALCAPGTIPRTTSGKTRHEAARESFLAARAPQRAIAVAPPAGEGDAREHGV